MEQEKIDAEKERLKEGLLPLLGSLEENTAFEDIPSTHDNMIYLRIKTDKGNYIAKKYLTYKTNSKSAILRDKVIKNPVEFEYNLLDLYSKEGANVPKPFIHFPAENTLVMADVGEDTLEKRLRNASPKTAVSLLNKVMGELLNLHTAAKTSQALLLSKIPSIVSKSSLFDVRAAGYYRELRATEDQVRENRIPTHPTQEEREFIDLFKIVTKNVYQNAQLVHGDMTTYHAIFKNEQGNEKVYFIDFSSPKFLPVTFDAAELVFSPGWQAPLEKRIEPFREYVEKDKLRYMEIFRLGWSRVDERVLRKEEEKLLFSGLFECLRCSTKSRVKRIKNPKVFEAYSNKHPSYASAVPHYRKMSDDIILHLIKNSSQYNLKDEETKRLENLHPKLNSLISLAEPIPIQIINNLKTAASEKNQRNLALLSNVCGLKSAV